MEISDGYLTYEEYKAIGGTLDIMPFKLLEYEVRRKINVYTFNRLIDCTDIPEEVKLCEYAMISCIENYNTKTASNISSENIDGYSVNYITLDQINNIINSKSKELDFIIRTYLLGVVYNGQHLLYVGVK